MTDEIKITPDSAREALYRLDGPIASEEGMIIENALTVWEEEREELQKARQEIGRLQKERDKLIEGLRWYGDRETYDGNVEWDDDGNIIRAEWPPINVDNGQHARDILKEIGVNVDD